MNRTFKALTLSPNPSPAASLVILLFLLALNVAHSNAQGSPSITNISPGSVVQGASQTVIITAQGLDFESASTMIFFSGPGITASGIISALSSTQIGVTITVSISAETGLRSFGIQVGSQIVDSPIPLVILPAVQVNIVGALNEFRADNSGADSVDLMVLVMTPPGASASITSVLIDLSSLGRSSQEPIRDDGISPDAVAGDSIYSVRAVVPASALTGDYFLPVTVTTSLGSRVSGGIRLAVQQATPPFIASIDPPSSIIGGIIRIRGNGFDPDAAANQVSFGDVEGTVFSVSGDDNLRTIEVVVPAGAASGTLTVRRGSLVSNSVQFNLGRTSISGLVTDAVTGGPISGALIRLGDANVTVRSDSSGRFNFDELPAGSYAVVVAAEGYASVPASQLTIDSPGERRLNFALSPLTAAIAGSVISSAGGRPVEGVAISVRGRTTSTNQSGNYLISGIRLGEVEISASARGLRGASIRIGLEAGRIHEVNFTLDPIPPAVAIEPQMVLAQPFDFRFTLSSEIGSNSIDLSQFRFIFDGGDISNQVLEALSNGLFGPVEMSDTSIRATIRDVTLPTGVHSVRISIRDRNGIEGSAEITYAITDLSPYMAPLEGLKAEVQNGQISLRWEAPQTAEVAGYEVRFGRISRNGEIFLENSLSVPAAQSHAELNLENGHAYLISVAPFSPGGRGLPVPEIRLTPAPPETLGVFNVEPAAGGSFRMASGLLISVGPGAIDSPSALIASAISPSALERRLEDSFLAPVGDFLFDISADGRLFSPLGAPVTVALTYNPALIPAGAGEDAVSAAISHDGYNWQIVPSSADVEHNAVAYQAPALTMAAAVLPLPTSELVSARQNFRAIFLQNTAQDYAEMVAAAFEDAWDFISIFDYLSQFLPPAQRRPIDIRILPSSAVKGRVSPFGGSPLRAGGAGFHYDRPIAEIGSGLSEKELSNAAVRLLFHIIANEMYASRRADAFIISPDYIWLNEAFAIFMEDLADDSANLYRAELNYQFIDRSLDRWSASYDPVLGEFSGDYGAFLFLKFIDEDIFGRTSPGLTREQLRSRPNMADRFFRVLTPSFTPRSNLNLALLAGNSTSTVYDLYAGFAFQFWALQDMDEFIDLRGGQPPYFGELIQDMALYESQPVGIWRGVAGQNRFRLEPGLFAAPGTFELELTLEPLASRGFLFEFDPDSAIGRGAFSLEITPERGSLAGAAFGLRLSADGSVERSELGEVPEGDPLRLEGLGSGARALNGLIIVALNDGGMESTGRLRIRALEAMSVEPESAGRGATIVVRGFGFSPNTLDNIVIFPSGQSVPVDAVDASGSELSISVPEGAGQGELRVEVAGLRSNGLSFSSPAPLTVRVSGAVRNVRGITGAEVRIDPPGVTATTGHDGLYDIAFEIERGLIGRSAIVRATAAGFEPQETQISLAEGDLSVNFTLSATPISVEIETALHHLGDDVFTNTGLGPFSTPAEGAVFERSFSVDMGLASPEDYSEAEIILNVSQAQLNNPISINGAQIGVLNANGSDLHFRFDPHLIRPGLNSIRIQSVAASGDPRFISGNLDDFEFSNARLRLR